MASGYTISPYLNLLINLDNIPPEIKLLVLLIVPLTTVYFNFLGFTDKNNG